MYEDLLARAPLFHDLPRRELTLLGDACREREYAAGETLASQGGGGAGFAFIMQGRVRVTARQVDGIERDLGEFGAGTALGEAATLEDGPSRVTVIALDPTQAVMLPVWDFRATLRDFPEIAIHLLAIVGRRLRADAAQGWTP